VLLRQAEASDEPLMRNSIEPLKISIAKDEYALAHHFGQEYTDSVWNRVVQLNTLINPNMGGIIALFVIITLSALVAGEFTEGTIKMLIPRPFSRSELLTSKFISALLYAIVLFVETLVIGFLLMGAFFGFKGLSATSLIWTGQKVVEIPAVLYVFMIYGLDFLQVVVYMAFALLIAVLSRSRALSTGVSIVLLVIGSALLQLLATYVDWGKYIVFAVTDLAMFLTYGPLYAGAPLGFALIVCAIYTAVFLFFSYFTFRKRDI
jgi:ABC-2 type transport system permease protein